MDRASILEAIVRLTAETLEVDEEALSEDTTFDDLDADDVHGVIVFDDGEIRAMPEVAAAHCVHAICGFAGNSNLHDRFLSYEHQ